MVAIITIDGPSGAGKSTVARKLALILGYDYVDSGALYRIVALKAIQQKIDENNEEELISICKDIDVSFLIENEKCRILYKGEDISDSIRLPEISMVASRISARKVVRDHLTELQREMGKKGQIILEGRDAGTVVFPEAPVKFFLEASVEERSKRRFKELKLKGINVNLDQVTKDIIKRDSNDRSRCYAPLVPAPDAVIIDSSQMTVEEVVSRMIEIIQSKKYERGSSEWIKVK
ncbi:MAG: (d)CMP kinase [Deltaproteobacteria bacterium]|nr:MAG: (d)CMP kinase [Deltaproteobacteria bacterium]